MALWFELYPPTGNPTWKTFVGKLTRKCTGKIIRHDECSLRVLPSFPSVLNHIRPYGNHGPVTVGSFQNLCFHWQHSVGRNRKAILSQSLCLRPGKHDIISCFLHPPKLSVKYHSDDWLVREICFGIQSKFFDNFHFLFYEKLEYK